MEGNRGTGPALDVVLDLVRAAAADGLLVDVGSLTDGLAARGWRRHRRGGVWELEHPVALGAWTSVTPLTASVHLSFEDDEDARAALAHVVARIEEVLAAPPQRDASHEPDQCSVWWEDAPDSDLSVSVVLLPSTSTHQSSAPDVTPTASLAVELRGDAWTGEEDERDAERARRLAREGTAVERWYLAGQRVLPPDVVTALEDDDDPLVVSAVRGHEHIRTFVAGQR